MSESKNFLLPLILDILSHKPFLCETETKLFNDIDRKLGSANSNNNDLRKQFRSTVDMGKGLGILSVEDEEVRMPFLLKNSTPTIWSRRTSKPKVLNRPKVKPKVNTLVYRSRSRSRTNLVDMRKPKTKQIKK